MDPMDIFDAIAGPMNWIDEVLARILLRSTDLVKYSIPRADKGGDETLNDVTRHLKRFGVDSHFGTFGVRHMTFYVRRSQRRWADWLVREISDPHDSPTGYQVVLNPAQTAWKERKPAKRKGFLASLTGSSKKAEAPPPRRRDRKRTSRRRSRR